MKRNKNYGFLFLLFLMAACGQQEAESPTVFSANYVLEASEYLMDEPLLEHFDDTPPIWEFFTDITLGESLGEQSYIEASESMLGEVVSLHTKEELVAFIIRAEKVYRDIVFGELFSGQWDEELNEWIPSGYVERVPELWVENELTINGGLYMTRYRVLPSSGFTSIADLNSALRLYWGKNFEVRTGKPEVHFVDFMEFDSALYFFPPLACGGWATRFIFETAQFEILEQTNERIAIHAELYLTAEGTLYKGALQYEIVDGRIVARNFVWGYVVE